MSLIRYTPNQRTLLFSHVGNKDIESRLRQYVDWLDGHQKNWWEVDLVAYREHLTQRGLHPASIAANLSTIRAQYRRLLRQRDLFFQALPPDTDFLQAQAAVNEIITRIENAIHPDEAPVRQITVQDHSDDQFLRLTAEQGVQLLRAPGRTTLAGKRDTALIATLLCTGIREQELVDLRVGDHKVSFGGQLALEVREGKGGKQRLVPWGAGEWAVVLIDDWLEAARISDGLIFRAVKHQTVQASLTTRSVQDRLSAYPIVINGVQRTVKPHDCRRSYARRMYDLGADPIAIQQNLGHSDLKTTLGYIGALDVNRRRPGDLWPFNL